MGAVLSLARFVWLGSLCVVFRLLTSPPEELPTCPICMDAMTATSSSDDNPRTAITLLCGHILCCDCLRSYVGMKLRDRQVETGQLVCPVVECRRALHDRDLRAILPPEIVGQYKRTLQRVRDEKNPLARWCSRPQCGELIMCKPDSTEFTCLKCSVVGCFSCRGTAHVLPFLCWIRWNHGADASFSRWVQSVGDGTAVRACPECHVYIWKSGGCNHMTCTHCRHEYCWVCDAKWTRRHYACQEPPLRHAVAVLSALCARFVEALRQLARKFEKLVTCVAVAIGCFVLVAILVTALVLRAAALVRTVRRFARRSTMAS